MTQPGNPRPDPGSPESWLTYATSDLALARLASSRPEILPEQASFHAQQAVEKAIKGVLVARGLGFPRTHDVDELLAIAEAGGLRVPAEVARAGALSPYAVESRYPGPGEEVTQDDVSEALALAQAVLAWATEMIRDDTQAGPT